MIHFHLLSHPNPSHLQTLVIFFISESPDFFRVLDLISMAGLFFKAYHNICACLDLTSPNSEAFNDLIWFLRLSKVYFSLTINPVVYVEYIRQFWKLAEGAIVDGITTIFALVNNQRGMAGWDDLCLQLAFDVVGIVTDEKFNFLGMIFQGHKYFPKDGKAKKFLAYPRFIQQILHEEIADLPALDGVLELMHLKSRVFIKMKKNN
ncbi:hypothetical protein L1987_20316 [Smallanthus sonchifolius]|uniref:Uncharacterized protein n=1 Tax=Smallanthus sonchifolius TaxID=185202 RepID=A0ACB9IRX7_9ASTR|nr:hypothetical protein L1987_20316 [Smallanthus sonchifolius]